MPDDVASCDAGDAAGPDPGTSPAGLPVLPWPREWPVRGRGERRDAAANRRRILAAARELVEAQDAEAVTMEAVARAAGVGFGTLYRRYPDRNALWEDLSVQNVLALQDEALDRLGDPDRDARDDLRWLLRRLVVFNEDNAPLLTGMTGMATPRRPGGIWRTPLYTWLHDLVAALLRRGRDRGVVIDVDPDHAAYVLLAPLTIDLHLLRRRDRGASLEDLLAAAELPVRAVTVRAREGPVV